MSAEQLNQYSVLVDNAAFLCSTLVDSIPFMYYVAQEKDWSQPTGGKHDLATSDARPSKTQKRQLRFSRYDPVNWLTTTTTVHQRQFPKATHIRRPGASVEPHPPHMRPQKPKARRPAAAKARVAPGSGSSSPNVSREELLQRLHAKLDAFKAKKNPVQTAKAPQSKNCGKRSEKKRQRAVTTMESQDADTFEFGSFKDSEVSAPNPKQPALGTTKKQRLLAAAQTVKRKERERAALTDDLRKASEVKDSQLTALQRAAGGRVYDDPKRLKKALDARTKKHTDRKNHKFSGRLKSGQKLRKHA